MREQETLELGRRDLEPVGFDELFEAIDDKETIVVKAGFVARVQEAVRVECLVRGFLVGEICKAKASISQSTACP